MEKEKTLQELREEFIVNLDFEHPYIKKLHSEIDDLKKLLIINSKLFDENQRLKLRFKIFFDDLKKILKRIEAYTQFDNEEKESISPPKAEAMGIRNGRNI